MFTQGRTTGDGRVSHSAGTLVYGKRIDGVDVTVSASGGAGVRSDREFRDFYGGSYDMQENGHLSERMGNLGIAYKGLSFRYITNTYGVQNQDAYYVNTPRPFSYAFHTERMEFKYEGKLAEDLVGSFQYNYSRDLPWHNDSEEQRQLEMSDPDSYTGIFFGGRLVRNAGAVALTYDPISSLNLRSGVTIFSDKGTATGVDGVPEEEYRATNSAIYGQAIATLPFAVFTVGTRYESNSKFPSALVSRAGLTKAFDTWHAKLLYSEAFRSPGYRNVLDFYDPSGQEKTIKPETTKVSEIEIGRVLTPNLSATLNLFDIHTKDTITYSYDAERGDTYGNYGDTGSRGLEAQMNYLDEIVSASLSYSFYRANNKNDYFAVLKPDGTPLTKNFLLATPAHKIVLQESTKLTENVQWTTSLSWYGKKYGYTGLAEDGETPYAESMDPVTLVNSNVLFKNVIGQWFDVQLGVNNVFNNRMFYAQPYNGYHAPLPGLSREGYITLIGRF